MLDREPFLKAIFADPDTDLPRLVFADYLEERGDAAWAELIRVQCELAHLPAVDRYASGQHHAQQLVAREAELISEVYPRSDGDPSVGNRVDRGFRVTYQIEVTADELTDPDRFRCEVLARCPEWYGLTSLKVTAGRMVTPDPLVTVFTSPVTEHVTELDLSGREEEIPHDVGGVRLFDVELKPVIAVPVVEALARMREVRRLTALDLRNNDLDNDALYALARSPYFIRLRRLALSAGNRFRGRVWRQVLERFGPDVVE